MRMKKNDDVMRGLVTRHHIDWEFKVSMVMLYIVRTLIDIFSSVQVLVNI